MDGCDDNQVTDHTTAQEEVAALCSDLIRIDTTNPGDNSGPGERAAAEHVAAILAGAGLEPQILESDPKRASVVARWEGTDSDFTGQEVIRRFAAERSVSGIPIGHEESMREFASVYRWIPKGAYETVAASGAFVVRRQAVKEGLPAIYAVNTGEKAGIVEISGKPGAKYRDVLNNAPITLNAQGKTTMKLDAFQMNVFAPETK